MEKTYYFLLSFCCQTGAILNNIFTDNEDKINFEGIAFSRLPGFPSLYIFDDGDYVCGYGSEQDVRDYRAVVIDEFFENEPTETEL